MQSDEEFYRDEHPQEEEPGSGGSGGGSSQDWGESWGSGGGGGGGGSSGGNWGYGWGSGSGSSAGDDDEMEAEWGGEEKEKIPVPILKRASGGFLLTHGNFLLHGLDHCEKLDQIFIFIPPDADIRHLDCALFRITDAKRALSATADSAKRMIRLYAAWGRPGRFQLELKWQRGHYNHAECGQMRVNAFGIELGWRTFALSRWSVAADIRIMPDYTVTVNNIKGKLRPEPPV